MYTEWIYGASSDAASLIDMLGSVWPIALRLGRRHGLRVFRLLGIDAEAFVVVHPLGEVLAQVFLHRHESLDGLGPG